MAQKIILNEGLWNEATTFQKKYIYGQLVHAGLLPLDAVIEGACAVPDLEEVEIKMRVKALEARFPMNAHRNALSKAFHLLMARFDTIAFARERKRCKNAAFKAYEHALFHSREPDRSLEFRRHNGLRA